MSQQEKIDCPLGLGEKTRGGCRACEYRKLDTCPVGMHFIKNGPEDRPVWEPHLVKEETPEQEFYETVCCPNCSGAHFKLHKVKLSGRILPSNRLDVVCIKCGYTESLYEIGGPHREAESE